MAAYLDDRELLTIPMDMMVAYYLNAHRDMGETDSNGVVKRQPAPMIEFDSVRTIRRGRKGGKSLINRDKPVPGGKHNLWGAEADKSAFKAWTDGKKRRKR